MKQPVRKLSLALDDLRVETFATSSEPQARGTVHANSHECESASTCYMIWCDCTGPGPRFGTCNASCGGTCLAVETCDWEGCDYTNANCPSAHGRPGCTF